MTENNSFNTANGLVKIGKMKALDSPIYIVLDVEAVAESLRAEIDKAIANKVLDLKGLDEKYSENVRRWCDEHMLLNWCFLAMKFSSEEPMEMVLHINAYNAEDERFSIWTDIYLDMNVSETEIKTGLFNLIKDKFF